LRYISTRGQAPILAFDDVLLAGLAEDGGLYVPERWPRLSSEELRALRGRPYPEIAARILDLFADGTIAPAVLARLTADAYAGFGHSGTAPLVQLDPRFWLMELFHGPTLAFKDYALQLVGRLFDHVLAARGSRITVVGATSGDTGSAAIEAVRDREAIDIFILFPRGRVSDVQRRQMTTVSASNVHTIAIDGTFDDCQDLVKAMFGDRPFREALNLSAVNSINFARIAGQVVYYVTAALALGAPERAVSFSVPTGNFGNIYAAYAARQMGLPIERLIVGANSNDILHRFFATGEMAVQPVVPTVSPAMDIQISSNFERFLFDLLDRDPAALAGTMQAFRRDGRFAVPEALAARAGGAFLSGRVDEEETLATIARTWRETGQLLDPHTAVGLAAGRRAAPAAPEPPVISLACAHPAKFGDAVRRAVGFDPPIPERLAAVFRDPERVAELPADLATVEDYIRRRARIAGGHA
jgi:threonine synthase